VEHERLRTSRIDDAADALVYALRTADCSFGVARR